MICLVEHAEPGRAVAKICRTKSRRPKSARLQKPLPFVFHDQIFSHDRRHTVGDQDQPVRRRVINTFRRRDDRTARHARLERRQLGKRHGRRIDARRHHRVAGSAHNKRLINDTKSYNRILDRKRILGRPRVRPVGLTEPKLVIAPTRNHAVRHGDPSSQVFRRWRPRRTGKLLVRRYRRVRSGIAICRRGDGQLSDKEISSLTGRAGHRAIDPSLRQIISRNVACSRHRQRQIPARILLAGTKHGCRRGALLAERRHPRHDVGARRHRRACAPADRQGRRSIRCHDSKRKRRLAGLDAGSAIYAWTVDGRRPIISIKRIVSDGRADDIGIDVREFEPDRISQMFGIGIVVWDTVDLGRAA